MDDIERYRKDPVAFIEECLIDPETGLPFVLYDEQKTFLRLALTLTPDGRLPYPELVFAAIKKSGKTAIAAMIVIYVVVVLSGPYAEGYCCANDLEQSQGRVYQAVSRIISSSPLLSGEAVITQSKITFPATGATITAIANDYAGAAGSNPNISEFDEPWGLISEKSHRFWDEQVPPPTRKVACRLSTSYAGFEGESVILESLYKRAMAGKEIAPDLWEADGLLCFWSHRPLAPWQTEAWKEQMRGQLRPNAFLRMIENRWTSGEESFVEMEWWDACTDPSAHPLLSDPNLIVYVGVDASTKRDSTAIAVCAFNHAEKKVALIWHRIYQPTKKDPLDFEATIEATLEDLHKRFIVRAIRYDPYQMVAVAERLTKKGLPMVEFSQTVPNLTEASNNLYELVKGRNLVVYPDADIRLAVNRSVAIETPRGWRITKEKASHKIDIVVALAQAALGAVKEGQVVFSLDPTDDEDYQASMPSREAGVQQFENRIEMDTSRPWD